MLEGDLLELECLLFIARPPIRRPVKNVVFIPYDPTRGALLQLEGEVLVLAGEY